MTRDTRLRDFGTAYRTTKRVIKEHTFFSFLLGSLCRAGEGFFLSLYEKGTTERQSDNEVVKKASTLTANGDPHLSGRSLFRGLAFLSTVPKE